MDSRPTPDSPLLTLKEAAAYLRRGRGWMLEHAREIGVIPDGGKFTFLKADLDRWIETHRVQAAPPTRNVVSLPKRRARRTGISSLTGKPFVPPMEAAQ